MLSEKGSTFLRVMGWTFRADDIRPYMKTVLRADNIRPYGM